MVVGRAIVVGALLALGACNQLLGISDVKRDDGGAPTADAPAIDAPAADGPAADGPAAVDAPPGAPDASPDAPACTTGAHRCSGNDRQACSGGAWSTVEQCANYCTLGSCVTPPSCSGGVATCGASASTSCCASAPVPGGTFARSYDGVTAGYTDNRYQATVSGFDLDVYEVSVSRFDQFVTAYPASKPQVGAGKNPHDAADLGWLAGWSAALPATQQDLITSLSCEGLVSQTSTDPVRCVSWYVAQAFCIWDGGRLPSEAEWNYAASGGAEQRVYPWSSPPSSTAVSAADAVYATTAPARPGAHSPAGDGKWGQADLAGNVWEWVLDYYADPYPTTTCDDCANHAAAAFNGNRGASFLDSGASIITSLRGGLDPTQTRKSGGFRCARDPQP